MSKKDAKDKKGGKDKKEKKKGKAKELTIDAEEELEEGKLDLYIEKLQKGKKLAEVETFIIKEKEITELSASIGLFENLTHLNLFRNKLAKLPDQIGKSKNHIIFQN